MNRFLVQVNRDGGFPNIMSNSRYQNNRWMDKPRDSDHGEVKPGDELVIYCTNRIPKHRSSLAFSVIVMAVTSDQVTFELEEPHWFQSPLKRDRIHDLVDKGKLPEVFRKCGQQGFNIAKLDFNAAELVLGLLNGMSSLNDDAVSSLHSESEYPQGYTIDSIVSDGCFLEKSKLEAILDRLKFKKNLILQGPPGTGKTWLAKRLAFALIGNKFEHQVRSYQFHPNLSYEDFVRGWRPSENRRLDLVDGPFLRAIIDAQNDPSNNYVIIIEEINRGNPAQIFGEMLTLLEVDKRDSSAALALSYSRNDRERVHIPFNLHVIGTMNVADRSLALVDFALRRRFAFVDLEPTFGERWREWVNEQYQIDIAFLVTIEERLKVLNQTITEDNALGPQFRVGHSVVTPHDSLPIDPKEWFKQVVETEISPLLGEYWFDDPDKARSETEKLLQGLVQ